MKYLLSLALLIPGWLASQTNIFGNLLSFNGANLNVDGQYVEILDDPSLDFNASQSFSIQFWIKPKQLTTTVGESHGIITKKTNTGSGYGVFWEVSASLSTFKFKLNDGSTKTLSGPNISNVNTLDWLHVTVAMERDANGLNDSIWMFFDGVVVAKDEVSSIDDLSNSQNVFLMRSASSGVSEKTAGGYLDEVRIWNTALSRQQVRRTYNEPIEEGGIGGISLVHTTITNRYTNLLWSHLVAYYDMEDPISGFSISDNSNNTNTGLFYEGPSGIVCSLSPCGPVLIPPPLSEPPQTFVVTGNGNWSNPSTWSGGNVPTSSDRLIVYVADGGHLTLDAGLYQVQAMNVESGSTLTSEPSSILEVVHSFDVDGTYNNNEGGTIVFSAEGNHIIDGNGSGQLDFFDLELIQANSQLQVDVPINIYGDFRHGQGRIRTNDQITLKANSSNASQPYGLIGRVAIGTPDVVGLIKMELELSNSNPGWRQLSLPFTGDLNDFGGITLKPSTAPANERNIFYWDNVADGTIPANNAGWTTPDLTSDQTKAYSVFLESSSFTNPITFEGEYNWGDKVYTLTYLNDPGNPLSSGQTGYENGLGWNFIPNLYPSLLNASLMTAENPLSYKSIHIWDAITQQYMAFTNDPGNSALIIPYNNNGTDLAELSTSGIRPFQGFWVKTSNAGETSFTLKNSWRDTDFSTLNPQASLKKRNGFQLSIYSDADSTWDGVSLNFNEVASLDFELEKDVYKLFSPSNVPSICFEYSGNFVSIKSVPSIDQSVKVHYRPQPENRNGVYHIDLEHSFLNDNKYIYLEDLALSTFHNLKHSSYFFKAIEGEPSGRFIVHYSNSLPNRLFQTEEGFVVYQDQSEVVIRPAFPLGKSLVSIVSLSGELIYEASYMINSEIRIPGEMDSGIYLVSVSNSSQSMTKKLMIFN